MLRILREDLMAKHELQGAVFRHVGVQRGDIIAHLSALKRADCFRVAWRESA